MNKIFLRNFSKKLNSLTIIYQLLIFKIVYDIVLIALLVFASKKEFIIYVFMINLAVVFLYLISIGDVETTFFGIIKFIFKKKK